MTDPYSHGFFVRCVPPKATHQSAMTIYKRKDGRATLGKSSKGRKAEAELMILLSEHRPPRPFSGAVALSVDWIYPYRKSEPKKNRGKMIPCITRPDADNLCKYLCDCLERLGFFENGDAQISHLVFSKYWGEQSGIRINMIEI